MCPQRTGQIMHNSLQQAYIMDVPKISRWLKNVYKVSE